MACNDNPDNRSDDPLPDDSHDRPDNRGDDPLPDDSHDGADTPTVIGPGGVTLPVRIPLGPAHAEWKVFSWAVSNTNDLGGRVQQE